MKRCVQWACADMTPLHLNASKDGDVSLPVRDDVTQNFAGLSWWLLFWVYSHHRYVFIFPSECYFGLVVSEWGWSLTVSDIFLIYIYMKVCEVPREHYGTCDAFGRRLSLLEYVSCSALRFLITRYFNLLIFAAMLKCLVSCIVIIITVYSLLAK